MSWLVTGGAGYIGSHVARAFREVGKDVVVVDDFSSGHRHFVDPGSTLVEGDIRDTELLRKTMREHDVEGVVHVAGYKYAGVSVTDPLHTYDVNVTGTVSLMRAMVLEDVDRVVFSSSAATFGTPDTDLVTERTPTTPESPYGESKLIGEWILRDVARAHGIRHTSLRYFNVVGSGYDDRHDTSPHNLFPLVFDALLAGRVPMIFGEDYDTPDGTCVRDYVHVSDLAHSHVAAARRLDAGEPVEAVYNLGSGDGSSVRQIMDAVRRVTAIAFEPEVAPRRPGDPARIVASGELAARDLEWEMRHSLDEMVASAWRARQAAEETTQHTTEENA